MVSVAKVKDLPSASTKFAATLCKKISNWFELRSNDLEAKAHRPNQKKSFLKIMSEVTNGVLKALIKKPPGAGKTKIYAGLVACSDENALVLIPSGSLRAQSLKELDEEAKLAEKYNVLKHARENFVVDPTKKDANTSQIISKYLSERDKNKKFTIVMTYQGLLSLARNDHKTFQRLMSSIGILISDEAHMSLGATTTQRFEEAEKTFIMEEIPKIADFLKSHGEKVLVNFKALDFQSEILIEDSLRILSEQIFEKKKAEIIKNQLSALCKSYLGHKKEKIGSPEALLARLSNILESFSEALVNQITNETSKPFFHLFVTATPELAVKSIEKAYGVKLIDSSTFEEIEDEGTIILPTRHSVGTATYVTDDTRKINTDEVESLIGQEKFVMEDGGSVTAAVVDKYLELRAKFGGYLPGICKCVSIEHAEKVTRYLNARGIKAVRCTTGNDDYLPGLDPDKAKELIELPPEHPKRIDVVVTVRQLGFGWDSPVVRAALMLSVFQSGWESIQLIGRIVRKLFNAIYPEKTRENTLVIEPDWKVRVRKSAKELISTNSQGGNGVLKNSNGTKKSDEYYEEQIINSLESLVQADELSVERARELKIGSGSNIKFDPKKEDHLRELIGSINSLIERGIPKDLSKLTFKNDTYEWVVEGSQLLRAIPEAYREPSAASEYLARLLWPETANVLIFDYKNPEHLKLVLKSPRTLMKKGQVLGEALVEEEFQYREGKVDWLIPRGYLEKKTANNQTVQYVGRTKALSLVEQIWGKRRSSKIPEDILTITDVKLKKMLGDKTLLFTPQFYSGELKDGNYLISAWLFMEEYREALQRLRGSQIKSIEELENEIRKRLWPEDVPATPLPTVSAEEANFTQTDEILMENEIKNCKPPENVDFVGILEQLCDLRRYQKPIYQVVQGPIPDGPKYIQCVVGTNYVSSLVAATDIEIAKIWAARKILVEINSKDCMRGFKVPPLKQREDPIILDEQPEGYRQIEGKSEKLLLSFAHENGLREPIGIVLESSYDFEHKNFRFRVQLVGEKFNIIASGDSVMGAFKLATWKVLQLGRNPEWRNRVGIRSDMNKLWPDDPTQVFLDENFQVVSHTLLQIQCATNMKYPLLLVDERALKKTNGQCIVRIAIHDLVVVFSSINIGVAHSSASTAMRTLIQERTDSAKNEEFFNLELLKLPKKARENPLGFLNNYLMKHYNLKCETLLEKTKNIKESYLIKLKIPFLMKTVRLKALINDSAEYESKLKELCLYLLIFINQYGVLPGIEREKRAL